MRFDLHWCWLWWLCCCWCGCCWPFAVTDSLQVAGCFVKGLFDTCIPACSVWCCGVTPLLLLLWLLGRRCGSVHFSKWRWSCDSCSLLVLLLLHDSNGVGPCLQGSRCLLLIQPLQFSVPGKKGHTMIVRW